MKLILSFITGALAGLLGNVVAAWIEPSLSKKKRITIFVFIGLLCSLLLFAYFDGADQKEQENINNQLLEENKKLLVEVKELKRLFELAKPELIDKINQSNYKIISPTDFYIKEENKEINVVLRLHHGHMLGMYLTDDDKLRIAIESINSFFDKYSITDKSKLEIAITGSADNLQIVPSLKYNGEYGLIQDQTYLNKNSETVEKMNINIGAPLNNKSLAFLRAYNLKNEIIKATQVNENQFSLSTFVSEEMSPEFREVTLEMRYPITQ